MAVVGAVVVSIRLEHIDSRSNAERIARLEQRVSQLEAQHPVGHAKRHARLVQWPD